MAFLHEPLFWLTAAVAFLAALIRGFSGFGAGLVFMPVGAATLGPQQAAGVLWIVDTVLLVPFLTRAAGMVDWREIVPLAVGAALTVPLGAAVLLYVDPIALRWGLSLVILASVAVLWAGWRYHGPTRAWMSFLVGGAAGFMSGAAQIPGPPVLIYWLGRGIVSATMRANAIVFFFCTTILSGIAFAIGGVLTREVLVMALVLMPIYGGGLLIGSRMFGRSSEATYRRLAYASILFVAIASMPVFG